MLQSKGGLKVARECVLNFVRTMLRDLLYRPVIRRATSSQLDFAHVDESRETKSDMYFIYEATALVSFHK
jgi:hypothetical protein